MAQPAHAMAPHAQPQTQPQPVAPTAPPVVPSGGSFWRGIGGGLLGGMLGSMLFRGGDYGYPGAGLHGPGLLDLLLLGIIAFLVYRYVIKRQRFGYATGPELQHFPFSWEPGPKGPVPVQRPELDEAPVPSEPLASEPAVAAEPAPAPVAPIADDIEPKLTLEPEIPSETSIAAVVGTTDPSFNLVQFKEDRLDDFFRYQAAFMNRDSDFLKASLEPEIFSEIEADLAALRTSGRVNKLENIAVRESRLVEAWQEEGKAFATVRFRANSLDYTIDEKTGEVVAGSKSEPVKFEEYWTFVRETGFAAVDNRWRLSAIETV